MGTPAKHNDRDRTAAKASRTVTYRGIKITLPPAPKNLSPTAKAIGEALRMKSHPARGETQRG